MARDRLLALRLTGDERTIIQGAAALKGLTASEFARQEILPVARELVEADQS